MPHGTTPTPGRAGGLLEVPPAALELLELPALDTVTDGQSRGADCVWCTHGPLTTETAVALGERKSHGVTRFPRACRPCVANHAHEAVFKHAPTCEQCVDEAAVCEVGRVLYRLIREGRR